MRHESASNAPSFACSSSLQDRISGMFFFLSLCSFFFLTQEQPGLSITSVVKINRPRGERNIATIISA